MVIGMSPGPQGIRFLDPRGSFDVTKTIHISVYIPSVSNSFIRFLSLKIGNNRYRVSNTTVGWRCSLIGIEKFIW